MAKAGPSEFVLTLQERLAPLGPVEVARLFGGWVFRLDGRQFAVVLKDRLYLCVDGALRDALRSAGQEPFRYAKRSGEVTVERFYEAPETCLDDDDTLLDWARRAVAANPPR